jgi:hypothetical protein
MTRIYGLFDEHDNIRYVGKTTHSLNDRLRGHISYAPNLINYKDKWISSMLARHLTPTIKELAYVEGDGNLHETFYILLFHSLGANLTNLTDGGDGGLSPEAAKKIVNIRRVNGTYTSGALKAWSTKRRTGMDKICAMRRIETLRITGGRIGNTREGALKAAATRFANGMEEIRKRKWAETFRRNGSQLIATNKMCETKRNKACARLRDFLASHSADEIRNSNNSIGIKKTAKKYALGIKLTRQVYAHYGIATHKGRLPVTQ